MPFKQTTLKPNNLCILVCWFSCLFLLSGCFLLRKGVQPITVSELSLDGSRGFESYQLERVQPGGSSDFDPFTFDRPGSPFGTDGLFPPGRFGASCGPMTVRFSPDFADPGDEHGSIIIIGNGNICRPTINTFETNVAVVFSTNFADEVRGPWSIVATNRPTFITVTNGAVTIRFTYTRDNDFVYITKVEFL